MLNFEANPVKAMPPEQVAFSYEGIVFGENPLSSGSRKRANAIYTMLEESGLVTPAALRRVPTVAGGAEANAEVLDSELRAGDLYVAYMGDGGLRDHTGAKMLTDPESVVAQTPLATLKGGNGNNFALSLHSRKYLRHPQQLLQDGKEVDAWPIRIEIAPPDEDPTVYYANTCFDLNAMAQIAHAIGKDSHRKHPLYANPLTRFLILESLATTKAMLQADLPEMSVTTDEQTSQKGRYLYLLANVSHIGKVGRTDARATEPSMHAIEIDDNAIHTLLGGMTRLIRGTSPHKILTETSIELHEETMGEIDGDAELLPAGTKINARISERSHKVLTTRPGA